MNNQPALRTCPVKGCTDFAPDGCIMCRPHWFKVSSQTRDALWRSHRAMRKTWTDEAIAAHRANVKQAIREATAI